MGRSGFLFGWTDEGGWHENN
uniref:Uncharacterized protein n=1 Tax=Arundo donax TaxID=35708 RepID=A0A0A9BKL4_ARUDO